MHFERLAITFSKHNIYIDIEHNSYMNNWHSFGEAEICATFHEQWNARSQSGHSSLTVCCCCAQLN